MVDNAMIGTAFTTLSLMDMIGGVLARPSYVLIMKRALRMEGIWRNMPFMFHSPRVPRQPVCSRMCAPTATGFFWTSHAKMSKNVGHF